MDYEWTNRPSITPSWSQTPRKRPHDDLKPASPRIGTPNSPIFGTNKNLPFIFNQETPRTSHHHPWVPPPSFSPEKAFPALPSPQELKDVDMSEASPNKAEEHKLGGSGDRIFSGGALRRVFRARQKARESRLGRNQKKEEIEGDDEGFVSADDEDERSLVRQNTSNHYTINMAAPPPPQSDLPYILSGYLQFVFNLALILLFLYLLVQFIFTVQHDVKHRISEYSMEIVQDISMCAIQYKTNLCATNSVPAMAQQCGVWETCMNRDPTLVGRARVGAELIAEVVNGFVEPISWKTLAFTLTSLAFFTVFINSLLSLLRARHQPLPPPPPNEPQPLLPRASSYPTLGGYPSTKLTPTWERSRSIREESTQTPSRRRRLEGGDVVKIH